MLKTYIGHSADQDIRYASSSGGITTAIVKYLFDHGEIETALGCKFNVDECRYEPTLLHSYNEYTLTGSVYQEMDIAKFIRANLDNIKGRILVICSPCQVLPIRAILGRTNIQSIIIDYFCSGQTTLEGTYCYYKFLGINKDNVAGIRYRGNGWPGGIEVTLKDGNVIKKANYAEPWKTICSSRLFSPKKCMYCKIGITDAADISVGDPWLRKFSNDRIGQTLFLVHTPYGNTIIDNMVNDGQIVAKEVDYMYYECSQTPLVNKPKEVNGHKELIDEKVKLMSDPEYRVWATANIDNMHLHITKMRQLTTDFERHQVLSLRIIGKIVGKIKTILAHRSKNVSMERWIG